MEINLRGEMLMGNEANLRLLIANGHMNGHYVYLLN